MVIVLAVLLFPPVPALTLDSGELRDMSPLQKNSPDGALLPDLVADVRFPELTDIVAPVTVIVRNQGKKDAPKARVELYDGDPRKGGDLIEKTDIPPLPPGSQHSASLPFRVFDKAGSRMLYAVVDPKDRVMESNETNNTAAVGIRIPSFILVLSPHKNGYHTDEPITVSVRAINLTSVKYKSAVLDIKIIGPAGTAITSAPTPIPELAPEVENRFEHTITLPAPLFSGSYQAVALLSSDKPVASTSTNVTIVPTLSLTGTLAGTPTTASVCKLFSIQYKVSRSGNIAATSGQSTIEVLKAGKAEPVFTKRVALGGAIKPITFDRLDLSPGQYTITLKGKASNAQHNITREFNLAEQPLTVSLPLDVKRAGVILPRVLILIGQGEASVQKAMVDKILKQAFDPHAMFHKITDDAAEFMAEAMSGKFNIYILLEQNQMIPDISWLQDSIQRGGGLMIIGNSERSRSTAESFGFRFKTPLPEATRMLTLTDDSGLALTGTLPVSGKILPPEKKGARRIAVLPDRNEAAALVSSSGNGSVLLMPFSLIRSAIETGAGPLYSALLSSALPSVLPKRETPGDTVAAIEMRVTSSSGPVKTKIIETLPAGSSVLWANPYVKPAGNTLMFELTADKKSETLLYLHQAPPGGEKKTSGEVFYECRGRFVSQGKVE